MPIALIGTPTVIKGDYVTSITGAHAVTSVSNRLLVVAIAGGNIPTAVTYGGVALTQARANATTSIYYLVNPTVGTANIVVSGTQTQWEAIAYSLGGVDQTTPVAAVAGRSGAYITNLTDAIMIATGGFAINVARLGQGVDTTPNGTQVAVVSNDSPGGTSTYVSSSYATSGAAMGWTHAEVTSFGHSVISLTPVLVGPTIGTHPSNQTATAGATATFTVVATASGGGALSYQWQRNSADISGATGASYTTPATTVTGGSANNGDTYRCVATETGGSSPGANTSNSATLTVNPAGDVTLPTLTGAITIGTVTATSIAFSWPAGADNLAVASYEVSKDGGSTWTDTLSTALSYTFNSLAASTSFGLRVRAKDAAGNVSTPALAATQSTNAPGDTTVPTLTGTVTPSAISFTSYSLSWPAGADNVAVAGYEVSFNGGASYLDNGAGTTRNVTGRTAGATDQVRVRAYDAAGNRSTPALSASVTLLTPALTLAVTNNTNSPLLDTAIPNVTVQRLSDRTQTLSLASQVTNGAGNLVISSGSLTAGVDYIVSAWNADGTQMLIAKATAA